MPTYNGARFLVEQVESIFAQTDDDFELLAIDDGSTDMTPDVLRDLAERDERMRVVPSKGNRGQNLRLAELMEQATGGHVAVADQDDRWAPDRNARLFAAMGARAMAFGRSELIDGMGRPLGSSLLELLNVAFRPDDRLSALLAPMFSAHATITRADRANREAFFHPIPFDWLMALEALFTDGLVQDDGAVVFHRMHGGNQVNNFAGGQPSGQLTGLEIRFMAAFHAPDRVRLWLVFDYLGRSRLLADDLRRTFTRLAGECRSAWFSEHRPLSGRTPGLRASILDALGPHAGSDRDRAVFAQRIEALTNPLLSRPAMGEVRRRYRLWRGGGSRGR